MNINRLVNIIMENKCSSGTCSTCHCKPCTCKKGHCCGGKEQWKDKLEKKIGFHKMMLTAMEEKDSEKRHAQIKEVMKKKIEHYESYLNKHD